MKEKRCHSYQLHLINTNVADKFRSAQPLRDLNIKMKQFIMYLLTSKVNYSKHQVMIATI